MNCLLATGWFGLVIIPFCLIMMLTSSYYNQQQNITAATTTTITYLESNNFIDVVVCV